MSQSLSNLLKEISTTQKQANLDLSTFDPRVVPAQAIAKSDAQKQLVQLTDAFNSEVLSRAAFMQLSGPAELQAKFVEVAQEEGGVLSISARQAYRLMADEIEPTIGATGQFGGTQLGHLIRAVENVGKVSNSRFLKVPSLDDVHVVKTKEDIVDVCRDLITNQLGPELNRNFIQAEICRQALASNFKEKIVPVVVTDATDTEQEFFAANLFNGVGITVTLNVDTKINKEFVLEQFVNLKDIIKLNKSETSNQTSN